MYYSQLIIENLGHFDDFALKKIRNDSNLVEQKLLHVAAVKTGAPQKCCAKLTDFMLCGNPNAPINGLPQDDGGEQPQGNLTFSHFQMAISSALGPSPLLLLNT